MEKDKYCVKSLTCGKEKLKQTSKYLKKETDSQIQGTNNCLPVGIGKGEGARQCRGLRGTATMHKINKLPRYILQHRKYGQYVIIPKNIVQPLKTAYHCYTPETYKILFINYT